MSAGELGPSIHSQQGPWYTSQNDISPQGTPFSCRVPQLSPVPGLSLEYDAPSFPHAGPSRIPSSNSDPNSSLLPLFPTGANQEPTRTQARASMDLGVPLPEWAWSSGSWTGSYSNPGIGSRSGSGSGSGSAIFGGDSNAAEAHGNVPPGPDMGEQTSSSSPTFSALFSPTYVASFQSTPATTYAHTPPTTSFTGVDFDFDADFEFDSVHLTLDALLNEPPMFSDGRNVESCL